MSEKLIANAGMKQLSTGDLFRKNISENTPLGIEAKTYMNEGKYVPDSVTNGMVKDYLADNHENQIFDGYPRTNAQAVALDEMLKDINSQIDKVLLLNVDSKVLHDRLTGRLICPKCKRSYHKVTRKPQVEGVCDFDNEALTTRPDDAPEKISVRIKEYTDLTEPLIEFYKAQNKLVAIDCNGLSSDEMYEKISEAMA
ncbi:hypothetical protein Zmor_008686 [Zophobas morio]|uniref:Adenylate kinase active site lid domain-containing protein n=1 Tax=Zophobas morio TaxID=2755281 RepID=A0AA38HLR4_9CUCU|nr:hypothetical protein Zmor_008686 [Zophobas morio]